MADLDEHVLEALTELLALSSPYVGAFMNAGDVLRNNDVADHALVIKEAKENKKTYNAPVVDEVAALVPFADLDVEQRQHRTRDIVIAARPSKGQASEFFKSKSFHRKNKRCVNVNVVADYLFRVTETHHAYDALAYPLLFTYGEVTFDLTFTRVYGKGAGKNNAGKARKVRDCDVCQKSCSLKKWREFEKKH